MIVTIVMLATAVLMIEFALVDTARLREETSKPVEVTFRNRSGKPWTAKVLPRVLPTTEMTDAEVEQRAKVLWNASQKVTDLSARQRLLQDLVAMKSSYQARARDALAETTKQLAARSAAPAVAPDKR